MLTSVRIDVYLDKYAGLFSHAESQDRANSKLSWVSSLQVKSLTGRCLIGTPLKKSHFRTDPFHFEENAVPVVLGIFTSHNSYILITIIIITMTGNSNLRKFYFIILYYNSTL